MTRMFQRGRVIQNCKGSALERDQVQRVFFCTIDTKSFLPFAILQVTVTPRLSVRQCEN